MIVSTAAELRWQDVLLTWSSQFTVRILVPRAAPDVSSKDSFQAGCQSTAVRWLYLGLRRNAVVVRMVVSRRLSCLAHVMLFHILSCAGLSSGRVILSNIVLCGLDSSLFRLFFGLASILL